MERKYGIKRFKFICLFSWIYLKLQLFSLIYFKLVIFHAGSHQHINITKYTETKYVHEMRSKTSCQNRKLVLYIFIALIVMEVETWVLEIFERTKNNLGRNKIEWKIKNKMEKEQTPPDMGWRLIWWFLYRLRRFLESACFFISFYENEINIGVSKIRWIVEFLNKYICIPYLFYAKKHFKITE